MLALISLVRKERKEEQVPLQLKAKALPNRKMKRSKRWIELRA